MRQIKLLSFKVLSTFVSMVSTRGVQDPEYRSRLQKELAFFNRIRSRTMSNFWQSVFNIYIYIPSLHTLLYRS